jgi:TatD DNase family protein
MELIDTHAHLYSDEFDGDRAEILDRAVASGIRAVFLPNVDSASIGPMLALEAAYPGVCFAMMGLHPCSVGENYREELAIVRDWLNRRHFHAIGEIGIDLYWDKTYRTQQEEAFLLQARWAVELDLPIVIHAREALDIILDLLQPVAGPKLRGIFHCFSGTAEQAARILDLGFLLGIGGVLTYKKSGLDEVLKTVPLTSLVLETDAPYLSPVPFRGKRNESTYITYIAGHLARLYDTTPEAIGWQTTQTAKKLFNVDWP